MTTETNAERLEHLNELFKINLMTNGDFKWLIQQAERAQVLDRMYMEVAARCGKLLSSLQVEEAENARLREALLELSQGKFDCYEDECANFALQALAGDPDGQR